MPVKEYGEVIATLLRAAESHQVIRRVVTGGDALARRLASTALRLFPATNRSDGKRENPFFRKLYEEVAEMLAQQGDLTFLQSHAPHSFGLLSNTRLALPSDRSSVSGATILICVVMPMVFLMYVVTFSA